MVFALSCGVTTLLGRIFGLALKHVMQCSKLPAGCRLSNKPFKTFPCLGTFRFLVNLLVLRGCLLRVPQLKSCCVMKEISWANSQTESV